MMGLPVIALRYSGLEDGIDHWAIPVEKYTMGPVPPSATDVCGDWANPDEDEIAETLRWCYENREEARQKGLAAAAWLREHQTWDHAAQKLITLLERYS
jgi:glycosyltransferase involved in cell wall biosynthesis